MSLVNTASPTGSQLTDCEVDLDLSSARTQRDGSGVDGSQASPLTENLLNGLDIWYDVSNGFDRYSTYAPIIVDKGLQCECSQITKSEVSLIYQAGTMN